MNLPGDRELSWVDNFTVQMRRDSIGGWIAECAELGCYSWARHPDDALRHIAEVVEEMFVLLNVVSSVEIADAQNRCWERHHYEGTQSEDLARTASSILEADVSVDIISSWMNWKTWTTH